MPLVVGILCGDVFPHVLSAWEYVAGFLLFLFIIGRSSIPDGCMERRYTFSWVYGVLLDELAAGKDGISLFGQNCCL